LAASFICLVFAMVFTISCSGDDGKAGPAGTSCTAVPLTNPTDGYNIVCGGEVVGPLLNGTAASKGDKGDPGEKGDKGDPGAIDGVPIGACLVKKVGTQWHAFCGPEQNDAGTISTGGGGGGGCDIVSPDQYNPFELLMNCGGDDIALCGGATYDPTTQVCTNGKTRVIDLNLGIYNTTVYNTGVGTAVNVDDDKLVDLGGAILSLASFKCGTKAGSTDSTEYNPNKEFCKPKNLTSTNVADSLYPLCGAGDYKNTHFCLETKGGYKNVVLKCNGQVFTSKQFCQVAYMPDLSNKGSTLTWPISTTPSNQRGKFPKYGSYDAYTAAGDVAFGSANGTTPLANPNYIPAGAPAALCGTEYEGKLEVNSLGEIITKTGGEWYTIRTSIAGATGITFGNPLGTENSIGPFGGLHYYANGDQKCLNNTSVVTQCKKGSLDAVWYNANVDFCYEKTANNDTLLTLPLCIKTSTGKPGTKPQYDEKNYFCNKETGSQARMCGGGFYDDTKQFCWGSATTGDIGTVCIGPTKKAVNGACDFGTLSTFSYNGTVTQECVSEGGNLYLRANYDPKTNNCGTIPDVQQKTGDNAYSTAQSGSTVMTKEVALPACGTQKINDGGWNWEFCVGTTVHYCGLNEVPNPDVLGQCKGCGQAVGEATGAAGTNVIINNDGTGYCKCSSGYVLNASNKCVVNPCAAGTYWNGTTCTSTCPASILVATTTNQIAGNGSAGAASTQTTDGNLCVSNVCNGSGVAVIGGVGADGSLVNTCCALGKNWYDYDGTDAGCK